MASTSAAKLPDRTLETCARFPARRHARGRTTSGAPPCAGRDSNPRTRRDWVTASQRCPLAYRRVTPAWHVRPPGAWAARRAWPLMFLVHCAVLKPAEAGRTPHGKPWAWLTGEDRNLHQHGRKDLNPQPTGLEAAALPLSYVRSVWCCRSQTRRPLPGFPEAAWLSPSLGHVMAAPEPVHWFSSHATDATSNTLRYPEAPVHSAARRCMVAGFAAIGTTSIRPAHRLRAVTMVALLSPDCPPYFPEGSPRRPRRPCLRWSGALRPSSSSERGTLWRPGAHRGQGTVGETPQLSAHVR